MKNRYYLVIRDIFTNQFEIIDHFNTLEEIDLYTISFPNKYELYEDLKNNNTIHDIGSNIDPFIVCRGKDYSIYEVLYYKNREIKEIANSSLTSHLEEEEKVKVLVNRFCSRMKQDQVFYNKVILGETSIYPKFVNYFLDTRFISNYSSKYKDGGWVFKSYPLLRNIEESMNPTISNKKNRELLKDKLLMMTSKNYNKEQYLLFDFIDDKSFNECLEKNQGEEYGIQKCKRRKGIR